MLQSNEEHMCKATALSFPKLFIAALPLKHDFKLKAIIFLSRISFDP